MAEDAAILGGPPAAAAGLPRRVVRPVVRVGRKYGVVSVNRYDGAGRLVEIAQQRGETLLGRFSYGLDKAGNRVAVTETLLSPALAMGPLGQVQPVILSGPATPGAVQQATSEESVLR